MKVSTVNVIEEIGESVFQLMSFTGPDAVKEAEEAFLELFRENKADGGQREIDENDALDDGYAECGDWKIKLVHSN